MLKIVLFLVLSNTLLFNAQGAFLSLQSQKDGNDFLKMIWASDTVVADIESRVYLKNLGMRLKSFSKKPSQNFAFYLLADDSINAFAGPFGIIGLHTGTLLVASNEAELAGVLAHEIAHITQNHLKRLSDKTSGYKYWQFAGLLAAVLANDSDISQAIMSSTIAGSLQQGINFTRAHEWEADREGIKILQNSGFDGRGLAQFFAKLTRSGNAQAFLSTHPLGSNRISDSLGRVTQQKTTPDSFEYLTAQARFFYHKNKRVKLGGVPKLIKYMQAYEAFELQKYKDSGVFVRDLLALDTSAPSLILAGRVYAKLGKMKLARGFFDRAGGEPSRYYLAQAYLQNKQAKQGAKMLRRYLNHQGGLSESYALLAKIFIQTNEMDRVHFYQAKSLLLQGKLTSALAQYNRAKSLTHSEDLRDILHAKIQVLTRKIKVYESLD
jgi:predicted Zn-dependent protease